MPQWNHRSTSDRLGRITRFEYNTLDEATSEKWYESDGTTLVRTIGYTFDDAGQLTQGTDTSATYGYNYDALGRVTYQSQSFAGFSPLIEYNSAYDAGSNLSSLDAIIAGTADFKNSLSYDDLDRLTSVTQEGQTGGNAVAEKRDDFAYNAAGQFDTISRFADVAGTELVANSFYAYDGIGRLTSLIHSMDATAPSSGWGTNPLAGYQFTYDAASRISAIDSYADGNTDYTYDNTDQLTGADHTGQTDESYSFDANGNRTMTGYSTGTNNQLSSDGTFNYTYDDEGNRLTKTNIATGDKEEYTWDWRNRLTGVTFKDSLGNVTATVTYAYDFLNQLIRRTYDSDGPGSAAAVDAFFSSENGQVNLQFDGTTASDLSHRDLWNPAAIDQLMADEAVSSLSTAGTVQYPFADHLGTLRDLASHNSGTHTTTIDNHRRFDDFGNVVSESNSAVDQIFAYTGKLYDEITKLQNNINRWYDASTGRWISEDLIGFSGHDGNIQRYVHNCPLSFRDSEGLSDKGEGKGPYLPPKKVHPPKGFKKGDIYIVIYVDQPMPGKRECEEGPGFWDYGHAFVMVVGYDKDGKLRYMIRGFYPSDAVRSLGNKDNPPKPQTGVVSDDSNHRYDVEYPYVASGPGTPTWEEMKEFIDSYNKNRDEHPYDLDDNNCADFALAVLRKAGHPDLKKGFGQVYIIDKNGNRKYYVTPNALGEDLKTEFPRRTRGPD